MAEPLPRYRKAGVLLADMPRLDFGDRREAARSLSTLDERLGQLSQWALGEATDRAKAEGLQYGAENPVTVQQLNDGTAFFQPRHTVFGDAARSAQVASLTSDIELESQQRINELKVGVERGNVDMTTARNELQALLDGSGKALAGIDPKASLKLRATLGATANSAYLAMTQSFIKRETENRKIAVDGWLRDHVAEQVRAHVQAGDTVDPDGGKVVTADDRINATLRSTLVSQLVNIGDDVYARQARTEFEKIVKDARIDALVKVASDPAFARDRDGKFDPLGAVVRLDKGDFGAYTGMYRAMPADDQAKVRTALRAAAADRWTAQEHVRAEVKRESTLEVNGLVREFATANPARSREIAARLGTISVTTDAISGAAINALIKEKKEGAGSGKGDASEVAETKLRLDIINGRIRTPELLWAKGLEYGAKPKQINEVLSFFVGRQNRAETEADRRLRTAAGLAPGVLNPAAGRADAYISMTRQLDEQVRLQTEAHRADPAKHPAPDREALAETIVKKRQESPILRGIENQVKSLNDQYGTAGLRKKTGITFDEDTDVSDARKALGQVGVSKAEIENVVKELQAIQQRRRQLNQLRN
jgi:hypothetical protein